MGGGGSSDTITNAKQAHAAAACQLQQKSIAEIKDLQERIKQSEPTTEPKH
jgi:hypothetical protein